MRTGERVWSVKVPAPTTVFAVRGRAPLQRIVVAKTPCMGQAKAEVGVRSQGNNAPKKPASRSARDSEKDSEN